MVVVVCQLFVAMATSAIVHATVSAASAGDASSIGTDPSRSKLWNNIYYCT